MLTENAVAVYFKAFLENGFALLLCFTQNGPKSQVTFNS